MTNYFFKGTCPTLYITWIHPLTQQSFVHLGYCYVKNNLLHFPLRLKFTVIALCHIQGTSSKFLWWEVFNWNSTFSPHTVLNMFGMSCHISLPVRLSLPFFVIKLSGAWTLTEGMWLFLLCRQQLRGVSTGLLWPGQPAENMDSLPAWRSR